MVQEKPQILLLCLDRLEIFDSIYKGMLNKLTKAALIQRAKTPDSALRILQSNEPRAILITPCIIDHPTVCTKVVEYVQNGGTAICVGTFASTANFDSFQPFFQQFGLPWNATAYTALTSVRNPAAFLVPQTKLIYRMHQMAIYLKNVCRTASLYLECFEDEGDEPIVRREPLTPCAFAAVGEGAFGFIGLMNDKPELETLVLAMCGLGD